MISQPSNELTSSIEFSLLTDLVDKPFLFSLSINPSVEIHHHVHDLGHCYSFCNSFDDPFHACVSSTNFITVLLAFPTSSMSLLTCDTFGEFCNYIVVPIFARNFFNACQSFFRKYDPECHRILP